MTTMTYLGPLIGTSDDNRQRLWTLGKQTS
jgi:hypothetical protein